MGRPALTAERLREIINRDHSDNRLANLRVATPQQNAGNTRARTACESGYKGVRFNKQRGRWQALITIEGRLKHIGLFDTPEQASAAYYERAQDVFGPFARQ